MQRRAIPLAAFAAISLATCVAGPASAYEVPPFKGNDTGGIIAWTLAGEVNARKLAIDHCAYYGKLMKPLASQRYYGGYISFACVWPRPIRTVKVMRTMY
jgi:hypothetical protein